MKEWSNELNKYGVDNGLGGGGYMGVAVRENRGFILAKLPPIAKQRQIVLRFTMGDGWALQVWTGFTFPMSEAVRGS